MTAAEAVRELVTDGVTLGIGGQTLGRVTMALAHEIIRQGVKDLTLVGCSMSMSMDMLVGAGLVRRTECGTGNLERIGTTMRWRRAIEEGRLQIEDYSHLAMASRFLAGSLGLPFMPSKSMLGTDIVNKKSSDGPKALEVIDNPWQPGRSCRPGAGAEPGRVDHTRAEGRPYGQRRHRGLHDARGRDGEGVQGRDRELRGADRHR